jgi:hemolysin activation/secretion protein
MFVDLPINAGCGPRAVRAATLCALWLAVAGAPSLAQTTREPAAGVARLVVQPPPPHPNPAPPEGRERIEIKGFEFAGHTLVPTQALQAAVQGFTGWRLMSDLTAAAQAAQQVYVDAGYGAVVVYPPPFDRRDPLIRLTVVEGRVGQVRVEGRQWGSEQQVRRSVPDLREGQTPRVQRIDMQIQMANENPARATHVTLMPGAAQGTTDAEVVVRERKPTQASLGLDNTGSALTGRYRVQAGWQHANLTGRDDVLALQAQTSPSHPSRVRVLSAAYRMPLYEQLWMVDALLGSSNIAGGALSSPIGDVRFGGNGRIAGLRGTRYLPRWDAADQRVSVALDRRVYRSRCDIAGLPPGSCGPVDADVTVHPVSVDYSLRSGPAWSTASLAAWSLAVGAQVNARLFGRSSDPARFDTARAGATRRQTLYRVAASANFRVGDGQSLRVRFNGQTSPDLLIPGEQFGLGGAQSLRGYAEREIAADRAATLSLEWFSAPIGSGADGLQVQMLAFVDMGHARNNGVTPCDGLETRCSLASWGWGLRLGWQNLRAQLDLARALRDGISTERGDMRGHMSVQMLF